MATVLPDYAGEAIREGVRNFVQLRLERQKMAIQQDQFNRQMSAEERRVAVQEMNTNASLFGIVSALEGQDVDIHDASPATQEAFQRITGLDVSEIPQGSIILNPTVGEDRITKMIIDSVEDLPGDSPVKRGLLERGAGRLFTGEGTTAGQRALQDESVRLRRAAFGLLEQRFLQNPRELTNLARITLGLPTDIQFNIGGREINFESQEAGALAVSILGLMQRQTQAGAESATAQAKLIADATEKLQEQYKSVYGKELGTGMARSVVVGAMSGNLDEVLSRRPGDQDLNNAAELFMGAAQVGMAGWRGAVASMPGGDEVLNFFDMAAEVSEVLPAEQRFDFMASITEQMTNAGFPILRVDNPIFGTARVRGSQTDQIGAPTREQIDRGPLERDEVFDILQIPRESQQQDFDAMSTEGLAEEAWKLGQITRSELEAVVGKREAARIMRENPREEQ